jgi:hypothetical protein
LQKSPPVITRHVLVNSRLQNNMGKECTVIPCHASRADIQTAKVENASVPKAVATGEEPIRF